MISTIAFNLVPFLWYSSYEGMLDFKDISKMKVIAYELRIVTTVKIK